MLMIVLQNVKSNESIRITLDKTNELGMSRLPQLIPREACSDPEYFGQLKNMELVEKKSNSDLATWALCSQALKSLAASASQNDSSSTTDPPIGQHLSTFVNICQYLLVFGPFWSHDRTAYTGTGFRAASSSQAKQGAKNS